MTNFRSLTSERYDLRDKSEKLEIRNTFLEEELTMMEECKTECKKFKHNYCVILSAYEFVRKELEQERDRLELWNNSSKRTQGIIENQVNSQKGGLGYDKREGKLPESSVIDKEIKEANTSE